MRLHPGTVATVIVALAFIAPSADGKVESSGSAAAAFDARGPGGLNIHGKTSELSASEKDGKVVIRVALARLTTGIDLRDRHMRDKYLEVAKYPDASVLVPRSKLSIPGKDASAKSEVSGLMTIHGVTHPVKLAYSATERGGKIAVNGSTRIDIREFGINVPSYLGIGVDPNVSIQVAFEVVDR